MSSGIAFESNHASLKFALRPVLFSVAFSIAVGAVYTISAFFFLLIPAAAIHIFGQMAEMIGVKIEAAHVAARLELGLFLWGLLYVFLASMTLGVLIGFFQEWMNVHSIDNG